MAEGFRGNFEEDSRLGQKASVLWSKTVCIGVYGSSNDGDIENEVYLDQACPAPEGDSHRSC